MSILQFPRIYYRGEISWDPGLANNFPGLYDPETVELIPPPGVPLEGLKQYILENVQSLGIWNYYGTHDASFEAVVITAGVTAPNQPLITNDPLIGKQISLRGKLVDLNAAAAHTSQIFYDEVVIGDLVTGVRGVRGHRMHARWINFARNLSPLPIAGIAAVVWQTTLAKTGLQLFGSADSVLLGALAAALHRDEVAGLMLRFQTYRTLYFQNGQRNRIPQQPRNIDQLRQLYVQGYNFSNAAYSAVVGTIGLWMHDDAVSAPGGRYLAPAEPVAAARRRRRREDGTIEVVDVPVPLGPAVAELDENSKILSLDLGSSVPERDQDLEKADIGELEIAVEHDGTSTQLATIPFAEYAREKYEERAGIIDVDLGPHPDPAIIAKIQQGRLVLNCRSSNDSRQGLRESSLTVIADVRDVYLDEDEEKRVQLKVFQAGRPAPAGAHVLVSAYDREQRFIRKVDILSLALGGTAELRLIAEKPGFVTYHFLPFGPGELEPTPPPDMDVVTDFYLNVRTLPFDNALERDTRDEQLTWRFIYDRVLRVYDTLNPVMSRTATPSINIPLDNEDRIATLALSIKRVIAKETFESPKHMPITRDMSAGRRRLLERWCDIVVEGATPKAVAIAAVNIARSTGDPRVARE